MFSTILFRRSMSKRFLAVSILVALTLVVFSVSYALAQDERITLRIWTFGSYFTDYYDQIIPGFEEMNLNVDVIVEEIPAVQMTDNLLGSFVAGSGAPDIVDIEQGAFSRFLKGVPGLIDLTAYIEPHADDYTMPKLGLYSYQGQTYGIDHCLCPVVLYYRTDLFENAGIETPVATWADFEIAAEKLHEQGISALTLHANFWQDYYMLNLQRGLGGIFDEEGNIVIDSSESIALLQWYVDMINKGYAATYTDNPSLYAMLQANTTAALFGADWLGGFIKSNVADQSGLWRAMPMPAWEDGGLQTSTNGGTAYTITAQSQHPDLAWEFIEYALFNEDNKILEFEVNNLLPPVQSMLDNPALLEPDPYFGDQALGELYEQLANDLPDQHRGPYFSEATDLLTNAVNQAVTGAKTPEQALTEMAAELRRVIAIG